VALEGYNWHQCVAQGHRGLWMALKVRSGLGGSLVASEQSGLASRDLELPCNYEWPWGLRVASGGHRWPQGLQVSSGLRVASGVVGGLGGRRRPQGLWMAMRDLIFMTSVAFIGR
jgi:hypothetical protein